MGTRRRLGQRVVGCTSKFSWGSGLGRFDQWRSLFTRGLISVFF